MSQPRQFTLFDLLWEIVHMGVVVTGCYVGWLWSGTFAAMFVGGLVGRGLVLCLSLLLWSWVTGDRTDDKT